MSRKYFTPYRAIVLSAVLVTCLLVSSVCALDTASYREGVTFGQQYKAEVEDNIAFLLMQAHENEVNLDQMAAYARRSEALYKEVLPEKVAWMRGVAEGSGIPYEHILVFNTVDRMITGFIGECTTFMAHGNALASGKGTIITKNRDLGSQTLSEIGLHQASTNPEGAIYQAAYIDIPDVPQTYKFIGSRSAGRWGYGMGVNEHQVIVSDNDAPSRDLLGFTESLHDNDLVRIILERAKTAREAVDVIAALVPKFGQAWNGIMFEIGDPNELWVVAITGPRWVAKQYTDTVAARSNQYQIRDDYDLAAPDLVSFAIEQGWVPEGTERIDFTSVYSTDVLYPSDNELDKRNNVEKLYNTEIRYQRAMELLKAKEGELTPEMFMTFARDHYDTYELPGGKVIEMNQTPFYSSEFAEWREHEWQPYEPEQDQIQKHMYIRSICHHGVSGSTAASAIMVARPDVPNELGLMLHAFMPPCHSTYVPFYVGITEVDHRYSSPEAAAAFQMIKARAQAQYTRYHDAIRQAFDPYEAQLFTDISEAEEAFMAMKEAGNDADASSFLTRFVREKAVQALSLTQVAQDNITQAAKDSSSWQCR